MKLTYRPEIDGLRAIAVGTVILYHAQITILDHQLFKGGFIGVDIFFVISGYLITSIILKELVITGTFSFKLFYERRVRRILPALLFVMLVSLPFAWMYLLPSSLIDFSKSILYSLGFSSNLYFWYSGQQYGAESGLLKPFLHIWSLSIEEQFYIIFPIVLLILFKYFRKYLIHILILGFIISLGLADWGSKNYPSFNFYVLQSRGWELLAGSILGYFEIRNGHRSRNKTLNLILPSIGLFLIGHSILFFNDEMFHPSILTLSVIIGVCLIIWFSEKDEIITKILSTKLFVGVGLISYSLYLWHYPIFAFARITEFIQEGLFINLLLAITMFILSFFSYLLIEKPFRKKHFSFRKLINIIFLAYVSLIFFSLTVVYKGVSSRMPNVFELNKNNVQTWTILKDNNGKVCNDLYKYCSFFSSHKKKIYLVGDSYMASLSFSLKKKLEKKDYNLLVSTLGSDICYPTIEENKTKIRNLKNYKYCLNLTNNLNQEENSIIVLGGNPLNYEFQNFGLISDNYFKLQKKNYLILVYPIPIMKFNVQQKIKNFYKKKLKKIDNKTLEKSEYFTSSYQSFLKNNENLFKSLDSIKGENIYRIYPHQLICDTIIKNKCLAHNENDIFYYDKIHPSIKASEMINDLIMKEIEKIEFKSN